MKKFYKMFTCILAVLALSITMLPSASALFRDRLYYYGKVEEIERDAEGSIESILVSSDQNESYRMLISDNTTWEDHENQTSTIPQDLAVGDEICVVHSSAVMMSLPPQSTAYAVIYHFPQGTDLEKERSAFRPIKKLIARAKQELSNWYYQVSPITLG